jgi:hypothetical protein
MVFAGGAISSHASRVLSTFKFLTWWPNRVIFCVFSFWRGGLFGRFASCDKSRRWTKSWFDSQNMSVAEAEFSSSRYWLRFWFLGDRTWPIPTNCSTPRQGSLRRAAMALVFVARWAGIQHLHDFKIPQPSKSLDHLVPLPLP